ncbi:MAG: ATP synthase subunit delta, chloroplastic [Candidatus Pacebacteria bacterium GW2011_GWF1_36_5]|nr:MAG: ATP synthase subunit delta, chloroplastic [Candidatus Pacebacteria bacterium GW2011_GWF1_36_5]
MLKITVASATPLNSTQKKELELSVAKKYEGEELVFNYQVKADLIAGLSVSVDSKLYDASLRARLDQLIKQM